jgi:hypothetical protein
MTFLWSIHLLPAGDVDRLAGHIAGLVGGEEGQHVGHVAVGAAALHRRLVDVTLAPGSSTHPPHPAAAGLWFGSINSFPEWIPADYNF